MKKILFSFTCLFLFAIISYAQSTGSLDSTFDSDGYVITLSADPGVANDVLIQPDGKIILGGYTEVEIGFDFYDYYYTFIRYNPDGSLDMTFGDAGIVNYYTNSFYMEAMELQSDGKILAAGGGSIGDDIGFTAIRLNTDGSVDTSFSEDGRITIEFEPSWTTNFATGIALQSDEKIILAGEIHPSSTTDIGIVRLNVDGSLDESFGDDGIVKTSIDSYIYGHDHATDVIVQGDDKIIVSGWGNEPGLPALLIRYLPDGSPDSSFDSEGILLFNLSDAIDEFDDVALQGDKILASGFCTAGFEYPEDVQKFLLARFNMDGSLDETFGDSGYVVKVFPFGNAYIHDILIQNDHKIVTAGYATLLSTVVARYEEDGSPDISFADSGYLYISLDNPGFDINALNIQADGKIIGAGYFYDDITNFAACRILGCSGSPEILDGLDNNCDGEIDEGLVSINSFANTHSITLYPNPNNGEFILRLSGITAIEIISMHINNMLGEEVGFLRLKPHDINQSINLNTTPGGIYVIDIVTDKKIYTQQIIIQK